MPTRSRHGWAHAAVQMFLAQTWPEKELIIIDDMREPSFPHGVIGAGVQHHLAPRYPVGAKRNLAVSRSAGEIIMHWDSDDIYSPDRMEYQVGMLLENPDADLVGFHRMQFVDEEAGRRYQYFCSPGHAIGVSHCYRREAWEKKRFNQVDQGEDEAFLNGLRVLTTDAEHRIVARIHSGNTCAKRPMIARNPAQWELLPA